MMRRLAFRFNGIVFNDFVFFARPFAFRGIGI